MKQECWFDHDDQFAVAPDDQGELRRAPRSPHDERCVSLLHYTAPCYSCAESTGNVHAFGGQLYCDRCCPACCARARRVEDDCFIFIATSVR